MADLTTLAGIEAELADTADYDVTLDVSKAKRRVAALRRKLDFPQSTGRGEQNIAFAMQAIENQLQQALAFVAANDTPTEAQRLANPDVVHADFSTFRGYSCRRSHGRIRRKATLWASPPSRASVGSSNWTTLVSPPGIALSGSGTSSTIHCRSSPSAV